MSSVLVNILCFYAGASVVASVLMYCFMKVATMADERSEREYRMMLEKEKEKEDENS